MNAGKNDDARTTCASCGEPIALNDTYNVWVHTNGFRGCASGTCFHGCSPGTRRGRA